MLKKLSNKNKLTYSGKHIFETVYGTFCLVEFHHLKCCQHTDKCGQNSGNENGRKLLIATHYMLATN